MNESRPGWGLRIFLLAAMTAGIVAVLQGINLLAGRPIDPGIVTWAPAYVVVFVVLSAFYRWGPTGFHHSLERGGWLVVSVLFICVLSAQAVGIAAATNSSPTLGLDLQGGFSVVLEAREVNGQLPSEESVEQAKDIIAQRVDGLGVGEPDITRQGRIVIVQLPGVTDRAKAESVVGCTAKLEFRPVLSATNALATVPEDITDLTEPTNESDGSGDSDEDTTTTAPEQSSDGEGETGSGAAGISAGEGALPVQFAPTTTTTTTTAPPTTTTTAPPTTTTTTDPDATTTTTAPATTDGSSSSGCGSGDEISEEALANAAPAPEGGVIAPSQDGSAIYTLGPVGFTGDALSTATATLQETWAVSVEVKGSEQDEANVTFNECFSGAPTCPALPGSGASSGSIAIVLDGQVISAPTVNGADLASDTFIISGSFDRDEAQELALVLRYGSLPVEFEQVALQQVSATLGTDSLQAGLLAGGIGVALVALYMLLYYRGLGLVVVAGLTVWAGLMYGIICWLSASQGLALTLSGIIGIVVSVGTTVDSYVVYFERLKDEVRQGRSVRSSTERGFNSAIRTIITADVASFLGAFLLWWLTVGPVRGFAFFLGISVILDLFVAYFFTRPVVALLSRSKRLTDTRFLGLRSTRARAIANEAVPA